MKILQVITSLNPDGGAPVEGLIQQGKEMAAAGHGVYTVSLNAPGQSLGTRMESTAVFTLGDDWVDFEVPSADPRRRIAECYARASLH